MTNSDKRIDKDIMEKASQVITEECNRTYVKGDRLIGNVAQAMQEVRDEALKFDRQVEDLWDRAYCKAYKTERSLLDECVEALKQAKIEIEQVIENFPDAYKPVDSHSLPGINKALESVKQARKE